MGAILLLMTIGGTLAAILLLGISFLMKQFWLRNFVFGAVLVWYAFYLAALCGASVFSAEKTLGPGEEKAFCGFYLDCHLSASVTNVRRAKTFGALKANHEFFVVKVKISNGARRAPLGLSEPKLTVVDEAGRIYEPTEDLTITVETPRFEDEIPAGGSLEDEIAFDLPADALRPRLDIRAGHGIDRLLESFLIGDEDSFLHRRSYFLLAVAPEIGKMAGGFENAAADRDLTGRDARVRLD
jgi:hypothetical protein